MATRTWARLFSTAAAVALSVALAGAAGAVPTSIGYVGKLSTASGPVSGQVNVSVTLWDSATGGAAVWGPQIWENHPVTGGALRLNIGGGGLPSLDGVLQTFPELWAQFTVNGDALGGRQALAAAPFAIIADNADQLGGVPAADYVTNAAFAAAAAAASHGATAPQSPAAGQLWFSTADQTLYAWDSGASEWIGVSVGDAEPSDLPTNGLNALSSGMLTNTFKDVSHLWAPEGGVAIQDATIAGNGVPAVATVDVSEASGGYITGIQIFTNFNLTSGNVIEMRLIPPAGMGSEVVFYNQALSFGTYGDVWNLTNRPGLAELLNKNPSGTWTLVVIDKDNNLAAPTTAGKLNSFEVRYDIVRADHVAANGLLEVDKLLVHDALSADQVLEVNGDVLVDGDLRVDGEMMRRVQRFEFRGQESPTTVAGVSGVIAGRQVEFQKFHDDTTLRIHWQDNIFLTNTNSWSFEFQIDGRNCLTPGRGIYWTQWPSSGGSYNRQTMNFIMYCNGLQPDSGSDPVLMPAGTYSLRIVSSRTDPTIGWSNEIGLIIVEEVY